MAELNRVTRFIKPFSEINTEWKLDSVLLKRNLIEPISNCYIKEDPIEDPLDDPLDDSLTETVDLEYEDGSMLLMPIRFCNLL